MASFVASLQRLARRSPRIAGGALALGLLGAAGAQAGEAAPAPELPRLDADIRHLAADALEGRNAGTEGSEEAARYLAERFRALGLEAVGDDGSYVQRFSFAVRGSDGQRAETVNVVGLVRGSDPALADEVVVVGAHYDHVGRAHHHDSGRIGKAGEGDDIWNGADDNASGTSAVLEVARCLAASGVKPRRSVLCILFGAEEHGLLGSQHYVSDPLIPLRRTVAMVNLDMVGRNEDEPLAVSGVASSGGALFDRVLDDAQRADPTLRVSRMDVTIPGGSDHTPFAMQQVPSVFVTSGLHEDYHRVTDHADKVSVEQVARAARIALALVRGVADEDEPPGFSFRTANPLPTLGRMALRELEAPLFLGALSARATDDGVELGRVLERAAGGRAGLQKGDRIIEVEGRSTLGGGGLDALRAALERADRYGTTRLRVVREGWERELIVVWRG